MVEKEPPVRSLNGRRASASHLTVPCRRGGGLAESGIAPYMRARFLKKRIKVGNARDVPIFAREAVEDDEFSVDFLREQNPVFMHLVRSREKDGFRPPPSPRVEIFFAYRNDADAERTPPGE